MTRLLTLAAVAVFGLTAAADDKPKKDEVPFKGTWAKEMDQFKVALTIETKDAGKFVVEAGDARLTLTLKYELKDGQFAGEVTKVEEKGDFPAKVPVGFKLKFTLKKVDDKTVKVSDYTGDNHEQAKDVVEGEYKKKDSD